MKNFLILTLLFITTSAVSVECNNLVLREGITYKKHSSIPFSGKSTGFCKEIYSGTYIMGRCDGRCRSYYNSESLFTDFFLKNRMMVGVQKTYWDTGNLMIKGNWKNGEFDGLWEKWNKDGSIWLRIIYKNGKCVIEIVGKCD